MNSYYNTSIRLIVTDDHRLFRQGIITSLEKYPEIEIVAEAGDGADLLRKMKQYHADAVTLNLSMPVMNGLETLPVLRKEYPDVKVIVVSMHNHHSVVCKLLRAGANAYLTKECSSEELYDAITSCMKDWLYINNTISKAIREELEETSKISS